MLSIIEAFLHWKFEKGSNHVIAFPERSVHLHFSLASLGEGNAGPDSSKTITS
jgi:hypothetical protein